MNDHRSVSIVMIEDDEGHARLIEKNIRRAGILRARAMQYRDAHAAGMTQADWSEIGKELEAAYRLLKKAVSSSAR